MAPDKSRSAENGDKLLGWMSHDTLLKTFKNSRPVIIRLFRFGKSAKRPARRAPSRKIALKKAAIDRFKFNDIGNRHTLINLMHRLADQTEFDHRAIILDEARI